jgi:hypothetical protein
MIRDELIALRLLIARRAPTEQVEPAREQIVREVEQSDGPFRDLILDALQQCDAHLRADRRDDALRELQLVHNLPAHLADIDTWDETHFFRVELFSYLESERDVRRIKRLLSLLGTHAARA